MLLREGHLHLELDVRLWWEILGVRLCLLLTSLHPSSTEPLFLFFLVLSFTL